MKESKKTHNYNNWSCFQDQRKYLLPSDLLTSFQHLYPYFSPLCNPPKHNPPIPTHSCNKVGLNFGQPALHIVTWIYAIWQNWHFIFLVIKILDLNFPILSHYDIYAIHRSCSCHIIDSSLCYFLKFCLNFMYAYHLSSQTVCVFNEDKAKKRKWVSSRFTIVIKYI